MLRRPWALDDEAQSSTTDSRKTPAPLHSPSGWRILGLMTGPEERIFSIRESQIENALKRRTNPQVVLKPQDLVVLLKLLVLGDQRRSFAELSAELSMSASEVHGSVGRAREARLLHLATGELQVAKASLKEFLLHGAKYAFPATVGAPTRGVPTAYAAPPLHDQIVQPDTELPPVWPTADGDRRGIAFYPLYPSVPQAARKDPSLYETLALFDALRGGAARERNLAAKLLEERFA